MKVCVIGDPHGELNEIKKIPLSGVDLILLTGDLGSAKMMREMAFENIERQKKGLSEIEYSNFKKKRAFMEAYNSTINVVKYLVKFAPVLTIFGNVEFSNSETKKYSKEIGFDLPFLLNDLNSLKNVRVINNKIVKINGIRIGGLKYFIDVNWVKNFKPTDYFEALDNSKKEAIKVRKILRRFNNLDILICHQPPYGFLDKVNAKFAPKSWQGKHAGSKRILEYIKSKNPKYVFCGHIHEGKGMKKIGKTQVYNLGVAGYKIFEI